MKKGFVCILSNDKNGTLYVGVTSNLIKRVYEHKNKLVEGFTKEYRVDNLVYYENYGDIKEAIRREKDIKNWMREWKLELIEKLNPFWKICTKICYSWIPGQARDDNIH